MKKNRNMDIICKKIWHSTNSDSEIIRNIECAKHRDSKFDINWINKGKGYNYTLMCAVYYGRKELVEYLLSDSNIDVNLGNSRWGNTAFHALCSMYNSNRILKLFLSHRDINVNAQNFERWTGLHFACWDGHIKCVKELLLDVRINTSIRNGEGNTARDIAIRRRHLGIANILRKTGYTSLLRIFCYDIARMIIENYV